MNRPISTAREALLVEALGDMSQLLDRIEALGPTLEEGRKGVLRSSDQLSGQLSGFEARMSAITANAKVQVVNHIVRRTDAIARQTLDEQTRSMEEAARALFRSELEPTLQRLVVSLRQLIEQASRPWDLWMMHAATALGASVVSWAVAAWFWAKW